MSRIRYYTDFAQDMVTSPETRELPSDYQWLPQTTAQRVGDRLIATVCRWVGRAVIAPVWHYHVVGLAKLRQAPQGIFFIRQSHATGGGCLHAAGAGRSAANVCDCRPE